MGSRLYTYPMRLFGRAKRVEPALHSVDVAQKKCLPRAIYIHLEAQG